MGSFRFRFRSRSLKTMGNSASSSALALPALKTVAACDTIRFMGTWYVGGVKPTALETTCSNAVEKYTLLEDSEKNKHDIDIDFSYNSNENPLDEKNKVKSLPQKGWVQGNDRLRSGDWKVSPIWPIKMGYPIIELDEEDYTYAAAGYCRGRLLWTKKSTRTLKRSWLRNINMTWLASERFLRYGPQMNDVNVD